MIMKKIHLFNTVIAFVLALGLTSCDKEETGSIKTNISYIKTNGEQNPANGAVVRLWYNKGNMDAELNKKAETVTDVDGIASFYDLPIGNYYITAYLIADDIEADGSVSVQDTFATPAHEAQVVWITAKYEKEVTFSIKDINPAY